MPILTPEPEAERSYGILFCLGGHEEEALSLLKMRYPTVDFLLPKKKRQRRQAGEKHKENVMLFPGYLFFEADPAEPVYRFQHENHVIAVLCDENKDWQLYGSDRLIAEKIFRERGVIELSKAYYDEGDRIHFVDGFLQGYDGQVLRVNRRACTVQIRVELQGNAITTWVGYELIEKSETKGNGTTQPGSEPGK